MSYHEILMKAISEVIIQICALANPICPKCGEIFLDYRMDFEDYIENGWAIRCLCGNCNMSPLWKVNMNHPVVKKAEALVCGDRSIKEEAKLRLSGTVPRGYELNLPELFDKYWYSKQKDRYPPPKEFA